MSQILMKAGFTITSLLPTLTNFSSNRKSINVKNTSRNGDVLFASAFYGRTISPTECLFVKTNRNMISETDLYSHTFTALLEQYDKNGLDTDGLELINQVSNFELKKNIIQIAFAKFQSVFFNLRSKILK